MNRLEIEMERHALRVVEEVVKNMDDTITEVITVGNTTETTTPILMVLLNNINDLCRKRKTIDKFMKEFSLREKSLSKAIDALKIRKKHIECVIEEARDKRAPYYVVVSEEAEHIYGYGESPAVAAQDAMKTVGTDWYSQNDQDYLTILPCTEDLYTRGESDFYRLKNGIAGTKDELENEKNEN